MAGYRLSRRILHVLDAGAPQQSVADALARRVEARRSAESVWARFAGSRTSATYSRLELGIAAAFGYAVGGLLPALAVPIRLLAGGVAYSRVHTGVGYPGDVVIGSLVGAGTAATVVAACDRIYRLQDPNCERA
jgi:undecaprenyl-diphosphatase